MDIISVLVILAMNIASIAIVYLIVKKLETRDKLIFIAFSVAAIYMSVSLIYWISGFGLEDKVNEYSKNLIVYSFVPLNVILLIPFVAIKFAQYKTKKIKKREYVKRIIEVVIAAIIILVVEGISFKYLKTAIYEKNIQEQKNIIQEQINNINTNEVSINANTIKDLQNILVDQNETKGNNIEVKTNETIEKTNTVE